jgi:hypothetical protein
VVTEQLFSVVDGPVRYLYQIAWRAAELQRRSGGAQWWTAAAVVLALRKSIDATMFFEASCIGCWLRWDWLLASQSESLCDWRSVSQYVLVSSPIWGLMTKCLLAVWQLLRCPLWGPCLTRGRVCLLSVIVYSLCQYVHMLFTFFKFDMCYIYNIYKALVQARYSRLCLTDCG